MFQKQTIQSLRQIRPLLERKLPTSCRILNLVNSSLSGRYRGRDNYVKIYKYVDDRGIPEDNEDNLFVCAKLSPKYEYSFTTLYAPHVVTKKMLDTFADLYDWSKPQEFGAVAPNFVGHLKNIFNEKKGTASFCPWDDVYLPVEEALELDIHQEKLSTEFELGKLSPNHATKINSAWKYGSRVAEQSIAKAIQTNGGTGVFRRTLSGDRSNENLVSWVVYLPTGAFNSFHTVEEYRGLGLGAWTLNAASKHLASKGLIPLGEIEPSNISQRKHLVEKIGWKYIQTVYWITYKPKHLR